MLAATVVDAAIVGFLPRLIVSLHGYIAFYILGYITFYLGTYHSTWVHTILFGYMHSIWVHTILLGYITFYLGT
jgi:hypothetical protein